MRIAVVSLVFLSLGLLAAGTGQNEKVAVCHVSPGPPGHLIGLGKSLQVSQNAVAGHLAHGDYLGVCGLGLPDDDCEPFLCDPCLGSDGVFCGGD